MSDPVQLTPDALESLLVESDGKAFAGFLADLYERAGHRTERQGTVVTTTSPDGDRERLLAWTDDRSRIERLIGSDLPDPDVDSIDAVVTRQRDAESAAAVAGDVGADVLDTADLHDRLLYAMDRESCRELCRVHFDREVEPRPAPETESGLIAFDALARPRIALIALVVCGLLVAGAAGLPGSGTPDAEPFAPGGTPDTDDANGPGPVMPVGAGATETATPTAPPETPTGTPSPTPIVATPPFPPSGEPELLEPCSGEGGQVLCLPPRPFSADHDPDITVGSTTHSLSGTFGNPYDSAITHASLRIETPPGWESQPRYEPPFDAPTAEHVLIGRLAPGESGNVSWVVSPPETADGGRYNVTLISEWTVPGYDGPGSTDVNSFRVRRNYTYRVRPAECQGVEPCSLLVGGPGGEQPFQAGTVVWNATNTTEGYLYNPHPGTVTNGTVTLEPPTPEWNVTPVNETAFEALGPGESRPVGWNITAPETADCSRDYALRGTARYALEGGDRITVPFAVPVSVTDGDGNCVVPL